jgi:hypothetical protein
MHIQLSPENANKLLQASQKLNRSVGDLVNQIVESIEEIDMTEKMKITVKSKAEDPLPKSKRIIQRSGAWSTRF